MIIPLYIYPAGSPGAREAWDLVGATAQAFPELEIIAIINPANGPGRERDPNYVRAVRRLAQQGVVLVGYVHLEYGHRPLREVQEDLRQWRRLYPQVSGIFFDEVASSADSSRSLAPVIDHELVVRRARDGGGRRVHGGAGPIIGNPGVPVPPHFLASGLFDIVVVHEETHWPRENPAIPGFPHRSALMVYGDNVTDPAQLRSAAEHGGYHFVNDHQDDITGAGTYPWSFLPRSLKEQARIIRDAITQDTIIRDAAAPPAD